MREQTGVADRLPAGVVYEATMRCNLKCEFCYVGDLLNLEGEWRQELTVEALRKAFPEKKGLSVSLTGGEVFVRKDVEQVLDLFREKGYACGYLTTNGTAITEARAAALADLALAGFVKHISVSIDGPGELHDAARGVKGTFERTAAGLRRLQAAARAKGAPLKVSINTTVTRESLDALDQMVAVAAELGVDAIGLNHLMYATPDEVDQTLKILGETDRRLIATYVTRGPGAAAGRACRRGRGARSDVPRAADPVRLPAEGAPAADRGLLHAGHTAARPLPLPVPERAGRLQRQGVLLPVHPDRGRRPHGVHARRGLEQPAVRRACGSGCSSASCSRCAGAAARWSCRPNRCRCPRRLPARRCSC